MQHHQSMILTNFYLPDPRELAHPMLGRKLKIKEEHYSSNLLKNPVQNFEYKLTINNNKLSTNDSAYKLCHKQKQSEIQSYSRD